MTIGLNRTSIGERPHRVQLQTPGPAVPDGDGGYTETWTDLAPPIVSAKIAPATAADLEHLAAGTVLATATHLVTMPYHAGVTTKSRIVFGSRSFSVTGVSDPEERHVETIAICVEVVA